VPFAITGVSFANGVCTGQIVAMVLVPEEVAVWGPDPELSMFNSHVVSFKGMTEFVVPISNATAQVRKDSERVTLMKLV